MFSSSPPRPPPPPPPPPAGGNRAGLAGSHPFLPSRNRAAFYRLTTADFQDSLLAPTSLLSGASQRTMSYARITEAVISQMLLTPGSPVTHGTTSCPKVLCPDLFATCPSFLVNSQQRLPLFASSTLTREMTESDSVVSSAMENLLISYAFAPRHLHT